MAVATNPPHNQSTATTDTTATVTLNNQVILTGVDGGKSTGDE